MTHGTRRVLSSAVMVALLMAETAAQGACAIDRQGTFAADREKVKLARSQGLAATANFGVFRAPLAVNTDGAPTSYHPDDYLGQTKAINRIGNGIAIRRADGRPTTPAERRQAFDRWRRSPTWAAPAGYRIGWTNVIAATAAGRPCIFQQGQYAGYFGSLTALRNGLSGAAAGECLVNDQLDQRFVPAIVLRGAAANPLYGYGARTGDLVLAMNPATHVVVPAVIGDTGDGNRIGEGSVALNMRLLGRTVQPTNYSQALSLDTGNAAMIVGVLPRTIAYRRVRPYSAANLADRVKAWAEEKGYGSLDGLAAAMAECASDL